MLAVFGVGEHGLHVALRVTARWVFLWFWAAYAGGVLFGWAARGRALGLSYAAAQTVHAGIVGWLFWLTGKLPLAGRGAAFFLVGLGITYMLAGLSFGGAQRLPGWLWRTVRVAGMEYIAFAFLVDFARHPVRGTGEALLYWPFIALGVVGTLARVVSYQGPKVLTCKEGGGSAPRPRRAGPGPFFK